jgi:YD repeat-containing protein
MVKESAVGAGSIAGMADAFQSYTANRHDGRLVTAASIAERGGGTFTMESGYDTQANPITTKIGTLEWQQKFDQDGNVTTAQPPARPETSLDYDARGNVTAENKPGQVTIHHGYSPSGAADSYRDPVDEVTSTTTDLIGRPRERIYADGTSETWTYDGERVQSMTDRQGRMFVYEYNEKGQLATCASASSR